MRMRSWILFLLLSTSWAGAHPLDEEVIESTTASTYTHVQDSNLYCSSTRINRIVCNFAGTAARLGSISFLSKGQQQQSELHLEISNCSNLWISSEFQVGWRTLYKSLYLTIQGVDDVVQEEAEMSPAAGDDVEELMTDLMDGPSASQAILKSELISFSLRDSKMASLYPRLVSDTRILMMDMTDSSLEVITKDSFRRVDKLWQLRVFRTNITRIESRAVPNSADGGGLSVSPAGVHVEWAPFILNETRVDLIEEDALLFNISEKDEYLNVVNSHFGLVKRGGLRVTGAGHFLVADSSFDTVEDDGFSVQLKLGQNVDPASAFKLFAYPTLTLMGLRLSGPATNVTNFLDNLQVTDGKVYLIRMEFHQPGALAAVVSHARLWNNRTTFIERWIVACNCADLGNVLLIQQADEALDETTESNGGEEETGTAIPGEEPGSSAPPSSHWKREVKCRVEGSTDPVELADFRQDYCPAPLMDPITEGTLAEGDLANSTDSTHPTNSSAEKDRLLLHLGLGGACFVMLVLAAASAYLYRNRKVSFILNRRDNKLKSGAKNRRPVNAASKKQVGVISEDPILEEECQL